MEELNLIPELRFSEFSEDWVEKKLEEYFEFKNGVNASKENYGSGYKFINVLDIINNDYITNERIIGKVTVSDEMFQKNIVKYGNILFQRSSETREEVGQSNVYLDNEKDATFGGFVIRGKGIIDYEPSFMNLLLKTSKARKEITTKSGGSTRYNVGQETLKKVKIQITTSLPEQTKIATFLTAVNKRINLLQKKKAELEQYKKGVMQKMFSQTLRFKKDDGSDFEDWEEKMLGEVCNYLNGGSFEKLVVKNGAYNLITLNSIDINGKLKNYHKKVNETDNSLSKGDLVMVLSDVAHGNFLGLTDIIPDDNFVLNQRMGALKPKIEISRYYLKTFINFNQKYFKLMGQGSSQQNLSKGDILKFNVLTPEKEEQKKITNFLLFIDKSIESMTSQIDDSVIFKKGLLQKMFV